FHRELAGREVFVDLVPRDRHGDRRVGAGAERVRRDGGLAAGVLEVVDVDPRAAFVDRPFDGGDLWILGGHRGSDVPGEGGGGVVVDGPAGGDVDVEPARARRLDAAREAEFLHLLADADRGPHDLAEPGAGTRVQVEDDPVGPVRVGNAGMPGVEFDGAHLDRVEDRRAGADVAEDGLPFGPGGFRGPDVVRHLSGYALAHDGLAVHTVGVDLEHERTVLEVA